MTLKCRQQQFYLQGVCLLKYGVCNFISVTVAVYALLMQTQ